MTGLTITPLHPEPARVPWRNIAEADRPVVV